MKMVEPRSEFSLMKDIRDSGCILKDDCGAITALAEIIIVLVIYKPDVPTHQ